MPKKMIKDKKTGKMRELRPYERGDGRFMRLVTIGKNPDGSIKRIPVYGKSRAEMDRNVAEIQYKLNRFLPIATEEITVKDYLQKWLDIYKKDIGHKAREAYQNVIDNHLYGLAFMEMRRVMPIHIQEYLNDFSETTLEATSKTPSKSLIMKARSVLNQAFNKAILDHITSVNPVVCVVTPKISVGKTRALTELEQKWFTEVAKTHRFGPLVLSMLYAGLRRGEAIALDLDSVNTKTGKLSIRHAISFDGNKPIYGDPKSEAGVRDIPVHDVLLSALKNHIEKIKSRKIVRLSGAKDHTLLFTTQKGGMMTESAFDRGWESFLHHVNLLACKELKVPTPINKWGNPDKRLKMPVKIAPITPHMLRHTYATLLCEADVQLKTAQVWFGHKDVKLLLRVYSDLRKDHDEREAKKFNAYLMGDKENAECSQSVVKPLEHTQ